MPVLNQIKPIVITSAGGNLVQPVGEQFTTYHITGSTTMAGNLQITPSGIPITGLTYIFIWKANLDIVTNSTTVTVFGQALTAVQVTKKNEITCTYNGSTWDVDVQTFNTEAAFIETIQLGNNVVTTSNLANGAVTASQIANGSITLVKLAADSVDSSKIVDGTIVTADLADGSVTTAKIVDANVTTAKVLDANITTAKIADQNVTTAKIADGDVTEIKLDTDAVTTAKIKNLNVTTAKINDDAVTNAKLATMSASSLKAGDSSGDPVDLVIGLDEIPIGNGTEVTVISLNDITQGVGQRDFETVNISFELGEQALNRVYLPKCYIEQIIFQVTKNIAATDDGVVSTFVNGSATTPASITYAAGSTIPSTDTLIFSPHPTITSPTGGWIELRTSKTTPGGKLIASIVYVRQ